MNAIDRLIDNIVADYDRWTSAAGFNDQEDAVKRFRSEISVKTGKKYIKIISGSSVWGFVVNVDNDKKFPKGTILKAAGWSTPTRNWGRGNVNGDYVVEWTGPRYLR